MEKQLTRRRFLASSGVMLANGVTTLRGSHASQGAASTPATTRTVQTPVLTIGYEESGSATGFPIILLHGFPDDARAWDQVAPPLTKAGHRVLVPYLRGYGPTRFRDPAAPRMAEQAAIGQDVIDFADALGIQRFAVAGYDWGGRAAAIAAALHPDRVRAAVLIGGNTIQDTISPPRPDTPESERAFWYVWYFNTERGRAGLAANRRPLCRLLWQTWSPTWKFTDETYERTAVSFDNPDFVDIVIHSYRHRNLNAPGEPRFADMERRLAGRPKIQAPSITLYGADDGLRRPAASAPEEQGSFTALRARRIIPGAGHFLPREKPDAVSSAMLELMGATS
jgi:pimeloyl-ACP methyl ester carboxylesterase